VANAATKPDLDKIHATPPRAASVRDVPRAAPSAPNSEKGNATPIENCGNTLMSIF
jgi:hypothetical protein